MGELLAIAIPTRNRAHYLKELLLSIQEQTNLNNHLLENLKIYIFDNVSEDNTAEVVNSFDLNIHYRRNDVNLGADLNIYQAYTGVAGQYVWVIGDDELLEPNALELMVGYINQYHPSLIINRSSSYHTFSEPWIFRDYLEFARICQAKNPHWLIAHSLISLNIVLKSCFDATFAMTKLETHYGFFYGMIRGMKNFPGLVLFPQPETVIVRAQRPGWADGIGPENILRDHELYLEWLNQEYNLNP